MQVRRPSSNVLTRRPRLIVFLVVGIVISGAIAARSLAPAIGGATPQLALAVHPGNSAALLADAIAEFSASEGKPAKNYVSLKARLTQALASEPLNSAFYSMLGLVADAEGDNARASGLMRTAASLSKRDNVAGVWLMRERFAAGDYGAAAQYAGVLLRGGYSISDTVAPVLTRMLETPKGAAHVERLVLDNPAWRAQYIDAMLPFVTDPRTPLSLMMAMKAADAAVSADNVRDYLIFLVNLKFYDLAYNAWLQFLPVAQLENAGFIYNGKFTYPPSEVPFDWRLTQGVGYTADIAEWPGGGGDRALQIQFSEGRVEAMNIAQTIVLRPGQYTLRGRYLGSAIGPRGLNWSIHCRDTWINVGESPPVQGAFADWRSFEWTFRIPDKECVAQDLRLNLAARSPSEQFVRGTIWFDDLGIRRAESASREN